MPILDVEIVSDATLEPGLAGRIAEAAAAVLASPPGTLWVKLRRLDVALYAENAAVAPQPVFVSVLKRGAPADDGAGEHARLANALARVIDVPVGHLHITYEPPAAGRQSFGGRLVE